MSLAPEPQIERYSSDFKFQMVIESLAPDKNLPEVAREKHIPVETLRYWRKRFFERGPKVFREPKEDSELVIELEPLEKVLGSDTCWPW